MEQLKKIGVLIVLDDRFGTVENRLKSVLSVLDNAELDFVLLVDNGTVNPITSLLGDRKEDKKLKIIRVEKFAPTGKCVNYAIGMLYNNFPYLIIMEQGTILTPNAVADLKAALETNIDEVSAAYGNLWIDEICIVHQPSFNRQALFNEGYIELPIIVNTEAIFAMAEKNPDHPLIDANMDILHIYDLLIRLTNNSMVLHVPKIVAEKTSLTLDTTILNGHRQYLQNKYGQQQIQPQTQDLQ